ncbi:Peritrophin-1 like protein [Argiope bruennichi]|uniref:Peritrophin-1 like protein n=1 Tax=Argiope bruennichi TaxID=94029 RepID=A0A8T0FKL9_ARGBR|nr:Peritrophin-1 like protein [Argiope bruennichi]
MPTSEIIQPNEKDIIVNQTCDCECCFYPNKTDCSRYTLCLDGYLHKGQCAEGLLFNHLDSNCDIAERVTCPQTSPSCPSQNGIYPHPTLCAAFYRCVNGQPFLEYCSENEHFKTSERKCVDPCDANCDKTLSCNTPRPPSEISGSPICIARDGLYPSEDDCSSYYMCTEGRAYPIKCPEGLHFNVEYGVCEPPCDARCDLTVDCPSPIQFAYSKSFEILPLHCPRPNGLFPVAGECGAYNLCSKGRAHLLHCPPGFHYSSKDETCETPCSAQCDKSVDCTLLNSGKSKRNLVPSVHLPLLLLCKTLSNGTLPNSKNCSSFYKCSNGKVHLMLCPRGLHFDPEDKTCKNPCLAGCDPNIQCPSEIPTPEGKCSCEILPTVLRLGREPNRYEGM